MSSRSTKQCNAPNRDLRIDGTQNKGEILLFMYTGGSTPTQTCQLLLPVNILGNPSQGNGRSTCTVSFSPSLSRPLLSSSFPLHVGAVDHMTSHDGKLQTGADGCRVSAQSIEPRRSRARAGNPWKLRIRHRAHGVLGSSSPRSATDDGQYHEMPRPLPRSEGSQLRAS